MDTLPTGGGGAEAAQERAGYLGSDVKEGDCMFAPRGRKDPGKANESNVPGCALAKQPTRNDTLVYAETITNISDTQGFTSVCNM